MRLYSALIAALLAAAPAAAQGPGRKPDATSPVRFAPYRDPAGRFEVEYPAKGWQVTSAGVGDVTRFARNRGPSVTIERSRLTGRPTVAEAEVMPVKEVQRLRRHEVAAAGFRSEVITTRSGRGVLIRYSRLGAERESVLHVTLAIGQDLYRVSAAAPEKMFARYEAILLHVIESFTAPPGREAPGT